MEDIKKGCRDNVEFGKTYLQIWLDAMLDKEDGQLLSAWHGLRNWTQEHMDKVLYPLASRINYNIYGTEVQQEYYRVDFSMYTSFKQSEWTLDYAVEHENAEFELDKDGEVKYKGWYDEFAKLLPLKCAKSRVIIGYDCFTDKFDAKLKKCIELLNLDKIEASVADSPIMLIIFPRTNYIRQGVSKGEFKNGLIHLVQFYKKDGVWVMDKNFEEEVCSGEMSVRLKEVYKKIAETPNT